MKGRKTGETETESTSTERQKVSNIQIDRQTGTKRVKGRKTEETESEKTSTDRQKAGEEMRV